MSRRRRLEQGSLFALSLLPLMLSASGAAAQALPSGGAFASGAGTITATSPGLVTIDQSTAKAIINWSDFSIGAGNSVQFNNGTGATLNRVTGGNISNLDGQLGATGSVYLINPNGVIIGSTGVVNVGGTFVASTLNITDANFLAGKGLTFQGASTASVVNLGQVGALGGDVALIATTVDNEGAITASQGSAGLLSGSKVLIRDAMADDGKFVVQVGGAGNLVLNNGQVSAAVAELRANGGNIYAMAGNVGSGVMARTFSNVGGRVFLTAGGAGQVTSNGAIAADTSVEMSGDQVAIAYGGGTSAVTTSQWVIDASTFGIGSDEAAALGAAAASGGDIAIRTHAGSGSGNINVNVALDVAGRDLTLSALRDITVDGQISGSGNKVLRADNTGAGTGSVSLFANLQGGRYDIYANASDYGDYASISADHASHADSALVVTHLLVNSYADLVRMRIDNGGDIFGNFALGRDIDADESGDGRYVGVAFQGDFDGLGHTISNLQVAGVSAGLFSELNGGNVSNLNLTGSVEGTGYAGAVAGHGYMGSITNVTSSMSVTNTGSSATGGLLGAGVYVTIDKSSASGAVNGVNYVGGLVGVTNDAVRDSFASGAVTGTADYVGGLVGQSNGYLVSDSFATGSVSGHYYVGGLVGYTNNTAFTNVYATGAVNADWGAGGLVGYMNNGSIERSWASGDVAAIESDAGGLVGLIYGTAGAPDVVIRKSYASGSVSGTGYIGGLIGEIDGNGTYTNYTIDNVYASGAVTGTNGYGFAGGLIGVVGQQARATVSNFYTTGAVYGGYAGGVAGLINRDSTYSDGYASGAVSAGQMAGGLFGLQNPGTVTVSNLYWDIGTTGQANAGGALTGTYAGLSTADAFKGVGSASNYTFSDPTQWVLSIDGLRPMLASEYSTTINNVHQLQLVQLNLNATYTLARDIDASETSAGGGGVFGANGFRTLGGIFNYSFVDFTGQLHGAGHQISDLKLVSDDYYTALFTHLAAGAGIDDLALVGGSITGTGVNNNGGGLTASLVAYNDGTVRNVSSSATVNGSETVGGLIGVNNGTLDASAFKGQATGTWVGGLVYFNNGLLRDSYFSGSATAAPGGGSRLAGVALYNNHSGVIQNVLVTGTLAGPNRSAIVRENWSGGVIENALWNSTSLGNTGAIWSDESGRADTRGYTQAELQDETQAGTVYAGFDLDGVWAVGSGASASSDGQAHFAELYRADNVMMVDARGGGSVYGDAINVGVISTHGNARAGDVIVAAGPGSTDATQGADAGTYALNYTGGTGTRADGGVLRVVTLGGSYVIAKRALTATLNGDIVKTYDGSNVAYLTAANLTGLSGMINGDVVSVADVMGTYSTIHAGTGLTVTASGALMGANARNYELTGVTGVGQINARVVTAGFNGLISKTYDGNATYEVGDSDFALGNRVDGDQLWVEYAEGSFNSSKVLQANSFSVSGLTLGGAAAGDYVLANDTVTGAGAITPRTLFGYLTGQVTKQYDGTDVAHLTDANYGVGNAIEGDDVKVSGPTTGTYASKNNNQGGNAIMVTVQGALSLSGADASNYVVYSGGNNAFARASVQNAPVATMSGKIGFINRRELTATITGLSTKTYDGTTAIGSGSLGLWADIVEGEDVHVTADLSAATYADKNAGANKAVAAGGAALGGADAFNYVLVSTTASGNVGTINAKSITAGLTGSTSKTYDGATAATLGAGNYVLNGLVGDDAVTVAGSATYADKNAGTGKTVTARDLTLSGAAGGNYVLSSTTASGAIGRIDAKTVTVGLTGTVTKTYDGSTSAALAAGNYGLTGVIGDEAVTVASTGAAYGDKNAGTGKTVTASGVSLGGADSGNYVLASTTVSGAIGTIAQRGLTITADDKTKNRNDADPALTYTAGAMVAGDTLSGSLTRQAGEGVGTYGILQGSLSAGGNYAVTFKPAVFTILLGIPPVDNLVIPYLPAEGGGAGGQGAPGQGSAPNSTGFMLAQEDAAPPARQEQDDTTSCSTSEACPAAPYAQGGSTSGAIHFQGFMQ